MEDPFFGYCCLVGVDETSSTTNMVSLMIFRSFNPVGIRIFYFFYDSSFIFLLRRLGSFSVMRRVEPFLVLVIMDFLYDF